MKERSKRKTSLKSSILILLLLAVFLITSTYAWFTSNQTVTVSSLQVNVQAQNGLQVSVDGTNWKTVISNDDIKGAIATYSSAVNQIPGELEPVSTAGTTTDGFLDMFYGLDCDYSSDEHTLSTISMDKKLNTLKLMVLKKLQGHPFVFVTF